MPYPSITRSRAPSGRSSNTPRRPVSESGISTPDGSYASIRSSPAPVDHAAGASRMLSGTGLSGRTISSRCGPNP